MCLLNTSEYFTSLPGNLSLMRSFEHGIKRWLRLELKRLAEEHSRLGPWQGFDPQAVPALGPL